MAIASEWSVIHRTVAWALCDSCVSGLGSPLYSCQNNAPASAGTVAPGRFGSSFLAAVECESVAAPVAGEARRMWQRPSVQKVVEDTLSIAFQVAGCARWGAYWERRPGSIITDRRP